MEKKVLIDVINPTGLPTTILPTDPKILVGSNTTVDGAGYNMVTADPNHTGQFMQSTYDPLAGSSAAEQICFRTDLASSQENFVVYFETKYTGSDYSANKMFVVEVKGRNGYWGYFDVFGQDFNLTGTPVQELLVPVQVTGPIDLSGYKANSYADILNVGVKNFKIQMVGSYGCREVTTFPRNY
jgi:hypothetical protein